ncbi:hypothetical protein OC861_004483 [Tilletia horrida]|nr:hypothetical protein OC861_004483 [Tilletia horrida]
MAPARQGKRGTDATLAPSPSSSKKQKVKEGPKQQSITSFFTSPNSKSAPSRSSKESIPAVEPELIQDDDDDDDEKLARRLQAEWDQEIRGQGNPTQSSTSGSKPSTRPVFSSPSSSSSKLHGPSDTNNISTTMDAREAAKLSQPSTRPPHLAAPSLKVAEIDLDALDAAIEAVALADDIFTFDPYSIDTSVWPHSVPNPKQPGPSKPMTPYALLTHAFVLVSSTKSRITITTVLTNLLRVLRVHDPEAMLPTVYLISNHIAPPYDGVELGIGGSVLHKATQSVTGKSNRFLKNLWDRTGDPGDVAFEAKKDVKMLTKPTPITVAKLFSTLHTIARLSGTGSQAAKLSHVTKLLVASRGEETRFLARTFISHLRIQAVRTTMATSLARAFALVDAPPGSQSRSSSASKSTKAQGKVKADPNARDQLSRFLIQPHERNGLLAHPTKTKDRQNARWIELNQRMLHAERVVREVRARHPNFSSIVPALLTVGLDGLSEHVPLRIGTPLSPMLASITRSLPNMHDKLGSRPFVSEYKYDGQRVQIHGALLPKSSAEDTDFDGFLANDGVFATESLEDDRALRQMLKDSGRGKWIKAGENDTHLVYVRLFSRHLEDQTEKYPDVLELVPLLLATGKQVSQNGGSADDLPSGNERRPICSFIMDAEVVAIGTSSDELLPFQTLAGRSRKDVQLKDVKVKVGIFAFDLMYLNGQTSFRQRRNLLHRYFPPLAPEDPLIACFDHVKSCESVDPDEVQAFFERARAAHCEGIMVKSLDHYWEDEASHAQVPSETSVSRTETSSSDESRLRKLDDVVGNDLEMEDVPDEDRPGSKKAARSSETQPDGVGKGVTGRGKALLSTYEPDKRCESWLKVKSDYLDSQDTLDLVPIGGWHGMGRKAQWWSPVLLALYDPETGVYQALCKCISGFTDAEYKRIKFEAFVENSEDCQEATSTIPPFEVEYDSALTPAFWWRPKEVWEVRCADITLSPVYTAARGHALGVDTNRGLSIRFPRFIKVRDDKNVEQATTPGQLAKMFREQMARAPEGQPSGDVANEEELAEVDDDEGGSDAGGMGGNE